MKEQRGSILVGVIALSLAMTLAAGGFIAMSANTSKDEIESGRDLQLHYAAEAGMLMGVCWTRRYDKTKFDPDDWPISSPFVLTRGTNGFAPMNGMLVKVSLVATPGGGGGIYDLVSLAKDGANRGTLEIKWQINSVDPSGEPGFQSRPNLQKWKETYHPYDL